ncbi:MAG: DoxX family protein [Chitinophagaceae bacterium]|nr:DoxX family protein [Chitinophagaceae bacterium]
MTTQTFSTAQRYGLVVLRILIGWHFLYEGIIKLYNPLWTAKGYLLSATILKPFFRWLADASIISVIDTLNIVGLIAVGISLIIGFKVRWGCIAGMLLLLFYYLAHPPFPGLPPGIAEGSYWIVNKNLIEMATLFIIYQFSAAPMFGIETLFKKKNKTSGQ